MKPAQRIVAHFWLLPARAVAKLDLTGATPQALYTAWYSDTGAGVLSWRAHVCCDNCQRASTRPTSGCSSRADISGPCDNLVSRAIDAVPWQRRGAPFTAAVHLDLLSPTNHNTSNCRQACNAMVLWRSRNFLQRLLVRLFPWSPAQQCQRPRTTCRFCDSSCSSSTPAKQSFPAWTTHCNWPPTISS